VHLVLTEFKVPLYEYTVQTKQCRSLPASTHFQMIKIVLVFCIKHQKDAPFCILVFFVVNRKSVKASDTTSPVAVVPVLNPLPVIYITSVVLQSKFPSKYDNLKHDFNMIYYIRMG
jgi:hypothetical protein